MTDPEHPLPHFRVGGRLLFRWDDIERWMEQFRVEAVEENTVESVVSKILSDLRP